MCQTNWSDLFLEAPTMLEDVQTGFKMRAVCVIHMLLFLFCAFLPVNNYCYGSEAYAKDRALPTIVSKFKELSN